MLGCVEENDEVPQPAPFPLTDLAGSAAANHEFLITHVQAGFTRQEAMQLLMLVMWSGLIKNA